MEPLNILSAYILDLVFGDPQWFPHPVRIIGRVVRFLDDRLKTGKQRKILRMKGVLLAVIAVGMSASVTYLILAFVRTIGPVARNITWIFLAYTSLATRDLTVHAKQVLGEVKRKNINKAREKVSMIVGRDTEQLSEDEVIRATIESIAENTNDGIIAPLFYLMLGGPALAVAYKAINTLDSMVGYKNERYLHFGWFSARLDDIANFIPARIAGFLIVLSSFLLGKGFIEPVRIMCRDARCHPSPNSGFPEAAMAGALGIRLGGASTYGGQPCIKPFIGEPKQPMQPQLINEALTTTFVSSILTVLIGAGLKWII